MDSKSLIGNYVCSEDIGKFEWNDGPLITAMKYGLWIILENFQESNDDILSLVNEIKEKHKLSISNRGTVIKAKIGFKIIASTTITAK